MLSKMATGGTVRVGSNNNFAIWQSSGADVGDTLFVVFIAHFWQIQRPQPVGPRLRMYSGKDRVGADV